MLELSPDLSFSTDPERNCSQKTLNMNAPTFSIISPQFFLFFFLFFIPLSPSAPLSLFLHLYFIQWTHLHSFFLFFGQKLYPTFITDTSLQFQIPTLCQIPISCCLISIHLLLFLLLLPFPAWTSSNPASSNFLRKAPYWVLLELDPLLQANGWLLFILPNNSCQYYCFFPFLYFTL